MDEDDDEEEELQYICHQNSNGLVWMACLLIGSESSMDIFNNNDYLKGIYKAKKLLKLHCNAGHIYVYEKGWFGDIEVWYHPKGIANILYLKTLKKQHHVTYDSKDRDGVFKVFTKEGEVEFVPHETRLHYLDLEAQHESGLALVTTIRNNFEGYTKQEVEGAISAHHF